MKLFQNCDLNFQIIELSRLSSSKEAMTATVSRWFGLIKMLLIIFVLHIYIYYTVLFAREKADSNDPACASCRQDKTKPPEQAERTRVNKFDGDEPQKRSMSTSNNNNLASSPPQNEQHRSLNIKLFYGKL